MPGAGAVLPIRLERSGKFGVDLLDLQASFGDLDYVAFAPEGPTGFIWSKSAVTLKALGTVDDALFRPAELLACHRSDADFVLDKWRNRMQ